jgi:predicted amidohydrolase YtcJ
LGVANTKALELAKITNQTPDPPDGRIDRDPKTGVAIGSLQEGGRTQTEKSSRAAMSREALREVLAEGRVVLRPEVANARFEGSLVLSHEEFLEQKQIDIKLVAGGRYELCSNYPLIIQAVATSIPQRDDVVRSAHRS